MTTPLTPAEIAELRDIPVIGGTPYNVISTPRDQWERLVSIAEDHARLIVQRACLENGILAMGAVTDALRAEVATLKARNELLAAGEQWLLEAVREAATKHTRLCSAPSDWSLIAALADPTPAVSEREGKGDTK